MINDIRLKAYHSLMDKIGTTTRSSTCMRQCESVGSDVSLFQRRQRESVDGCQARHCSWHGRRLQGIPKTEVPLHMEKSNATGNTGEGFYGQRIVEVRKVTFPSSCGRSIDFSPISLLPVDFALEALLSAQDRLRTCLLFVRLGALHHGCGGAQDRVAPQAAPHDAF